MAYAHTNSKGTTYYLRRTVTKLKNGREPSDGALATALHCFRWHVALESLRRQGLVTVDAISAAIFDPSRRLRVRLRDPATGRWRVDEIGTGESVSDTLTPYHTGPRAAANSRSP